MLEFIFKVVYLERDKDRVKSISNTLEYLFIIVALIFSLIISYIYIEVANYLKINNYLLLILIGALLLLLRKFFFRYFDNKNIDSLIKNAYNFGQFNYLIKVLLALVIMFSVVGFGVIVRIIIYYT